MMDFRSWSAKRWARTAVVSAVVLLAAHFLSQARAAMPPFVLGAIGAYLLLPLVNRLDNVMRPVLRLRRVARSLAVFVVYGLAALGLLLVLAFIVPTIAGQIGFLAKRLPELVQRAYTAVPEIVQEWLDTYNRMVPDDVRSAIERSVLNTIQSLLLALQAGIVRTVTLVFSTLSFVFGLLIVPLWTFFVLRDQPEMDASFYRLMPPAYREDMRNIRVLVERVLGAYLRGQLVLCFSVGFASTVGYALIGLDFALLLGTVAGIFEIVPVLGPTLGAIPALLVALATRPDRMVWVIVLAFMVQQVENAILVPQISAGIARMHPAVVMVILVVGSAVGGVVGVLLSVPLAATVRDVALYLSLRLADHPLEPFEALARVSANA